MDKSSKQKLMIEYLLSSPDTFALCRSILKSEYFNPELRNIVQFMHEYYDGYNSIPSFELIHAETGDTLNKQILTRDEISYCTDEIEKFCKRKAIQHAVIKSSTLIDKEKLIQDAVAVSLYRNTGSDYFLNVSTRLERMSRLPQRISTGWKSVDELLGGGLARTELILFSANSGGGKSITLANYAINMVLQNYNVLYLSLELSSDMVEQRFDTMFTGIPTVNWQLNIDKIVNQVTQVGTTAGQLFVERYPAGTTSHSIRALLKEFELRNGFIPDVLVVDYLDQMGANEKVSYDNISQKDKLATEQLRDILEDYNMIGATASQQTRGAIDATELNQGHIAGGITKVNTVDWYISIVLTPAMKAKGEILFVFLKSRSSDAVGKQTLLKWDNIQLKISDSNEDGYHVPDIIDECVSTNNNTKRGLLDIMSL
jgi:KaiC/GvpD/RAD55 family RecA-like ATPase